MSPLRIFNSHYSRWKKFWFGLSDITALEVIRIGTGVLVFFCHLALRPHLEDFFGSSSWIPAPPASPADPWILSVLFLFNQTLVLSGLNLFVLAAALLIALGFAPAWIKWPLLIAHISFLNFSPAITYGVDAVLSFLLFALCLAPVGFQLSLANRFLKNNNTRTPWQLEWGSACLRVIQIQMAVVFFYTGISKLRGETWWSGDALWIVLTNYEFLHPTLLDCLSRHYWTVNLATYATLFIELTYPFLIWPKRTRFFYLTSAILLHAGIAISMRLYLFSLVSIVGHLAFLNPSWWKNFAKIRFPRKLPFLKLSFTQPTSAAPLAINTETAAAAESDKTTPLFESLRPFFSLDLRTLAVFRIALACIILRDLFVRATDLTAHYSDTGILPRSALFEHFSGPWLWSIHFASGLSGVQIFLFILAAFFAFLLLVGYRTRLMTVLSWFFLVSLQNRNHMILQGGDLVLRMLFFWSCFLPLGARFSIDRLLAPPTSRSANNIYNAATAALILQMAFIFFFAALHKSDPVWRIEGTAVYYALMIDQFVTPFGRFLLQFPSLLKVLTFTTYYLELMLPLFIFFPVATARARIFTVIIMLALQAGFASSLVLGLFPWIMSAGWLLFLPSEAWGALGQSRFGKFLSGLKRKASLRASGLISLRFFPRRGGSVSTKLPLPFQIAAAAALLFVFCWNVRSMNDHYLKAHPTPFDGMGYMLNLDQTWNMFSPRPLLGDGWFVIPGKLKDGTEVDLFRGGKPVSWDKPEDILKDYPNQRWRKYLMNIWKAEFSDHRLYYGRYLCRDWNGKHINGKQVNTFDIYFMQETTLPEGKTAPLEKILLWRHACFDSPQTDKK